MYKTLSSYWIDQSFAENKKLTLLLVGSDKDIDNETYEKIGGELTLCTDYDEITEFLNKNSQKKITIVSTYQSSNILARVCCDNAIDIDMCIFDEAHKIVGQSGKQFNLLLDDDYVIIWNRLFMTATSKIYNGKINDIENDTNIVSMDNVEQFGENLFEYNTSTAINDNILTDYSILSLVCTNQEVELMIKNNKLIKYKKEFDEKESQYLANILLILKKIHDGTINHLITYHNTLSRSRKFCEFLNIINKLIYKDDIFVDTFDGTTCMNKRNKIIRDFVNSPKSILCSARVLNEGVNIPIVDSVCFVDDRNSTIDIQQCCGRAIRKYKGKKHAYIIIPTFIESLEDEELNEKSFGNTIRILKAMKNTDDSIVDYFLLKDNEKKANIRKPIQYEYIGTLKKSNEIQFDKWTNTIDSKIIKIIGNNDIKRNLLFEFVNKFKRIPKEYDEYNGIKIGCFYGHQKEKINNNLSQLYLKLSTNSIIKENLDKYLSAKGTHVNMETKVKMIIDYVNKYNKFPKQTEIYDGMKIGQFFDNIKANLTSLDVNLYEKIQTNLMLKQYIDNYLKNKELNKKIIKLSFQKKHDILIEFINNNNCVPKNNEIYNGFKLGSFYRHLKVRMTEIGCKSYNILATNQIIKNDLDKYFENKPTNLKKKQFTNEEKNQMLFSFVELYNRCPKFGEIYENVNINTFYSHQKARIVDNTSEIYKILAKNKIIKENLDNYLIEKNKQLFKESYTTKQKINMLIEHINTHNKMPVHDFIQNGINLYSFFMSQKTNILNTNSNIYLVLSKHPIIKLTMDENIKRWTNKKQISIDEKYNILIKFVTCTSNIPSYNQIYHDINLGQFYTSVKRNVSYTSKSYLILSQNDILKDDLICHIEKLNNT